MTSERPRSTIFGRVVRKGSWLVISQVLPIEKHTYSVYRLTHWLYERAYAGFALAATSFWSVLTGIFINPAATIGDGLIVYHGQGIVIGGETVIGDRCIIHQQVTIGGSARGKRAGEPTIGDDVILGAGAKVIGPVHIGDGARVGANAVVTHDVAPGILVAGIPARPIGDIDVSVDMDVIG